MRDVVPHGSAKLSAVWMVTKSSRSKLRISYTSWVPFIGQSGFRAKSASSDLVIRRD